MTGTTGTEVVQLDQARNILRARNGETSMEDQKNCPTDPPCQERGERVPMCFKVLAEDEFLSSLPYSYSREMSQRTTDGRLEAVVISANWVGVRVFGSDGSCVGSMAMIDPDRIVDRLKFVGDTYVLEVDFVDGCWGSWDLTEDALCHAVFGR